MTVRLEDFLVKDLVVIPKDHLLFGKNLEERINHPDDRLENIKHALANVSLNGHYLEFGVASGRTVNFIASIIDPHVVYGFDSFEGLPEEWETYVDVFPKGSFKQNTIPEVRNNCKLVKGLFNDTLPDFTKQIETTAFLHVDCDLYSSTKTIFDTLGHTLKVNSIIVFDEYHCIKDEHKAFVEWLSATNFTAHMISRTLGPEQVTFILKERAK